MKKRILLLIPCILLALGLLTACGDNGSGSMSDEAIENHLINVEWEGKGSSSSGTGSIGLPFDLGNLLKFKFKNDGTGSVTILENSAGTSSFQFYWTVEDGFVNITFKDTLLNIFKFKLTITDNKLNLKADGPIPLEFNLTRE